MSDAGAKDLRVSFVIPTLNSGKTLESCLHAIHAQAIPRDRYEIVLASEPIAYTVRSEDPALTRYFALLGMNDPLCLFTRKQWRRICMWTTLITARLDNQVRTHSLPHHAFPV